MMDYDIRAERVDEACAITPGIESPTVSPLHREGWVAVRAMVPRADAQWVMDSLWDVVARAIFVTDILACRRLSRTLVAGMLQWWRDGHPSP